MNIVSMWRPTADEVEYGFSTLYMAEDTSGDRWVLRNSLDDYYAFSCAHKFFEDIVPFTTVLEKNDEVYSAQKYVKGKTAHKAGFDSILAVRTPEGLNDLANIIGLDMVINNHDRHSNNWMVLDSGRLAAIDNSLGLSFINIMEALRPAFRTLIVEDSDRLRQLLESLYKKVETVNNELYSPNLSELLTNIRELEGFKRG